MGKNDIFMKRWLSDKKRFADLINGSLFQGKQIFVPENMKIEDGGQGAVLKKPDGEEITIQRYRDITMAAEDGTRIVYWHAKIRMISIMQCLSEGCCMTH